MVECKVWLINAERNGYFIIIRIDEIKQELSIYALSRTKSDEDQNIYIVFKCLPTDILLLARGRKSIQ